MSNLDSYEEMTRWKQQSISGLYNTRPELEEKVDVEGHFLPYTGSTVVFRMGPRSLLIIEIMKQLLHQNIDEICLAEPLPIDTMHMTLHDLISPSFAKTHHRDYSKVVTESIDSSIQIVEGIRADFPKRTIHLVADRIVNMASTSVALLLRSASEQDYEFLMRLYQRFDKIHKLPYPFLPHVTLAYFRPGQIDGDEIGRVVDVIQIKDAYAPEFSFHTEDITAQKYYSMKQYVDVPQRICFCCDGGMNRSVMAAQILNYLAKLKGMHITAEARAAYHNTDGAPIPRSVWEILEMHEIPVDRNKDRAICFENCDESAFSQYAAISPGALDRLSGLHLPEERTKRISEVMYGVPDPAYRVSYERAFEDIYERIRKYISEMKEQGYYI